MSTVPPSTPPPGGTYTPPPPPPPPPPAGGSPSSDRTLMVVLAYLGILSLIPFLTKKDDPDIYWHGKNGFALFLAEMVVFVVRIALIFIRIPFLTCGLSVVFCVIWLGFLAISILCIVKALNNERFRIPMISDFADKM